MVNTDDEQNWAYLLAPTFQCVNTSGKPLTEGYINVYIHGTRDKYYCAKDFDGTLHPFNIPLDSLGANIVLAQPLYTFDIYVYNKYGSLQMSRYNVKPHTDVGEAIAQLVEISSSDNTVGIDRTSATGWNLSIKDTVDRVDAIEEALDGFKTKQEEYSQSGGVTKTITNITQDENGEINVTYEDIDLPPEVPTVEITSPNDTIQISSSTDPETNVKTFEIDVKNSGMEYFTGNYGRSRYETRTPTVDKPYMDFIPCYVDSWSGYDYKGDFIINDWQAENSCWFFLKPGLYYINAIIQFEMTDGSLLNQEGWYACARGSGDYNETNDYFYHDWSNNSNIYDVDNRNFNTVHISYVKNVTAANGRNGIEFCPKLPYGISYVCIREVQIVKLDSAIAANGTEYVEGQGIKILNDIISVREGAGLKFSGNDLMVNTGSGINIVDDKLVVNESYLTQLIDNRFITEISNIPGSGLSIDEDNKLNVNIGTGLALDEFNRIYVTDSGSGMEYNFNSPLHELGGNVSLGYDDPLVDIDGNLHLAMQYPFTVNYHALDILKGGAIGLDANGLCVNVNPSSGIDIVDNALVAKVGNGLTIDPVSGVIVIDSDVGDVVATVEKLKHDLDTQITVNFDMPNISNTYDFADASVNSFSVEGACMLFQAFTIPINHEIRIASIGEEEPTLLGIYAKQSFDRKIMLALYAYNFESGFTDYVGDTGPVYVNAGRNEYPLLHKNPNITELTSSCVYYASLYLPSNVRDHKGLILAGCPNYGAANAYINAVPRFTIGAENLRYDNAEIDMTDATTGRLDYNDGLGNYYIGPWYDSYNERPAVPRFFMQVRNGTPTEHYEPTAPFTTLGSAAMPTTAVAATSLPNFSAGNANSCFRDVTPVENCEVSYFEWLDDQSSAGGWVQSNCVYTSGFNTNLSGLNNVVTNGGLETTVDGHNVYRHRITFGTPLQLTANTTYRFLCEAFTDTSYVFSRATNKNTIHASNNGWYIEPSGMTRYNDYIGKYILVHADGTDYEL